MNTNYLNISALTPLTSHLTNACYLVVAQVELASHSPGSRSKEITKSVRNQNQEEEDTSLFTGVGSLPRIAVASLAHQDSKRKREFLAFSKSSAHHSSSSLKIYSLHRDKRGRDTKKSCFYCHRTQHVVAPWRSLSLAIVKTPACAETAGFMLFF